MFENGIVDFADMSWSWQDLADYIVSTYTGDDVKYFIDLLIQRQAVEPPSVTIMGMGND